MARGLKKLAQPAATHLEAGLGGGTGGHRPRGARDSQGADPEPAEGGRRRVAYTSYIYYTQLLYI